MKVIHLISGGDTGGAKTHVLSLLSQLKSSIDAELICFMSGPFAEEAAELGIPTLVFEGSLPKVRKRLIDYISAGGYDIIHCHGSRANLMGVLIKKVVKKPVISTIHSDYRLDYLGRPISRLTYGTINTIALRFLDFYIGVCDPISKTLIKRGFKPEKVFSIYNGIDFDIKPGTERSEFLKSLGISGEDIIVVGIAARLSPIKDISTLLRGFSAAADANPKLRLVIAGDGEERETLQSLVKELKISEKVCFAGWVSDTVSFFNTIDINVLTSLSEGFPYVLTEGARASKATISTNVGGIPDLIDHGVNGFLINKGDWKELSKYLIKLAGDVELRNKIGQAMRDKASRMFSLENIKNRQLEIYETVLRKIARKSGRRDGVTICGAYGRGNTGDDAILEAIINELRSLDADIPICVLSRTPKLTKVNYRVNSVYTFNFPGFILAMLKSRLYINGGGSLIQDITSSRSLQYYLFNITAAKLCGNKVLMYGCGIGPVNRKSNRHRAGRCINRYVDVITLREESSVKELKQMGVKKPEIILSADPALTLKPASDEAIDSMFYQAGVPTDGKFICFSLRPWQGFSPEPFASAADYAYEKYGLKTVFFPVEPTKDREIAALTGKLMKSPYYIFNNIHSAGDAIGLMSRMKLVVSMRLHALIFAACQGIPLIGAVYDQKVSSFLDYIGQDLFDELKNIDADVLESFIDRAMEREGRAPSDYLSEILVKERLNTEAARCLLEL